MPSPQAVIRSPALSLLALVCMGTLAVARQDEPWLRMDYGPFLSISLGIGDDQPPVHKGLVVRLRTREGDPTDLHAVFDTDLCSWRCAWEGEVVLSGIVYDGPHGTFPWIEGEPLFRTPALPGVVPEGTDVAELRDPRDEPWGPIPASVARWRGLHLDGDDVVFEYTAADGRVRILERVWAEPYDSSFAFVREITTATEDGGDAAIRVLRNATEALSLPANGTVVEALGPAGESVPVNPAPPPRTVHEAIAGARPRWGEPRTTLGVIDDPLDAGDRARRIPWPAGSEAGEVTLMRAQGDHLELFRRGEGAGGSPVSEGVVLRSARGSSPEVLEGLAEEQRLGWWPSDVGTGTHEHNALTGEDDLRLDGVTWRRGVVGRSLDFDGTAAAWLDGLELDLVERDLTVAAWIHTTKDGTVFSVAPPAGAWAPDGATLFLRGGRLSFDVGWVGVVTGGPRVADGAWHHVAATWRHDGGEVRLFVDGDRVAAGELPLRGEEERHTFVPRFGWTNPDFPEEPRFSGYMDGLALLGRAVEDAAVPALAEETGEPVVEGTVVRWHGDGEPELRLEGSGLVTGISLLLPAVTVDSSAAVLTRRGPRTAVLAWADGATGGSAAARPFRVDRLTWPEDDRSWMRFGALDFLPSESGSPESAVITTWSGDLWRVDGLDEDLGELRWTRVATGLNQPFGVVARRAGILVLGRDQITRVHDRNGDGEADFLESFTNAGKNSEHFHEPASGLLVAPDGGLLYVKAARHALHALHDHHGTALRVAADGSRTTVVARGFRAPIGLGVLPDGSLLVSDQEGHWMPANKINLIRPSAEAPPFHGNGWAARPGIGERIRRDDERVQPAWDADAPWTAPLCWIHPEVDRSPSAQLHVDHPAWGPLDGALLGLSYGTGEVYLILRDDVEAEEGTLTQGGIVKLGIQLPTGLLAGRVHPGTGDLYVCGLFGWSSNRTQPGGFYRVRPLAEEWRGTLNVPRRMRAREDGLELEFLFPLDPASAGEPERWSATAWNYVRSAEYGSATYDLEGRAGERTELAIRSVRLAAGGRTVLLEIADFQPSMQLDVTWEIADASGRRLEHGAHLTVHALHAD